MTADDMVSVPTDDLRAFLKDRDFDAGQRLWALVDPPPKFDPEMVDAVAKAGWKHRNPNATSSWGVLKEAFRELCRGDVIEVLTVARNAGWEMVETTELEALRGLVADSYPDLEHGDWDGITYITEAHADAIRKAKAAGRG